MVDRKDINKTWYMWIVLQIACIKKKNNYIEKSKHNQFLKIKVNFKNNKITKIAKLWPAQWKYEVVL